MGNRVQYKRGKKLPHNTKYVGRPSRWGNPATIGKKLFGEIQTLDSALMFYRLWLADTLRKDPTFLYPLIGYDLACYCPLDQECHVDILLEKLGELYG